MKACTQSFAERSIAFAAVEGILFSGSFLRDLWLKFACLVYNMSQNKLPDAVVHDIVRGAVIAERHTEVRIQCYQAATAAFGA